MKYQELIEAIEKTAPPYVAEEWDNSGIQINSGKEDIGKILVCLELTKETVAEAIDCGADMIISHHPLFFDPIKKIDSESPLAEGIKSRMIADLIKADIGVYSAHTSFDSAPKGNNWYLATLLGLTDLSPAEDEGAVFITGKTEKMTLVALAEKTAETLGLEKGQIRFAGDPAKIVEKAAVCTGAGADQMDGAFLCGCDALITGDVKYHQAVDAVSMGMGLIDAGHYGTEKIFAENLAAQLRELCGDEIEVIESVVNTDPFVV